MCVPDATTAAFSHTVWFKGKRDHYAQLHDKLSGQRSMYLTLNSATDYCENANSSLWSYTPPKMELLSVIAIIGLSRSASLAKRYNYPGAVIDEYESADGKAPPGCPRHPRPFDGRSNNHPVLTTSPICPEDARQPLRMYCDVCEHNQYCRNITMVVCTYWEASIRPLFSLRKIEVESGSLGPILPQYNNNGTVLIRKRACEDRAFAIIGECK
ncbi:hypothetical protein EAG_07456 [Camponotus floridanus]|uniref:Uncharacterized protein n=1 Tax=Camponotus floridanus TaxID=104421 RepID=E2ACK0_CAMFO|nr:hypothetical protein EAG_07456 [Camponotus floridanus]